MRREHCVVLLPLLVAHHFGPVERSGEAAPPFLSVELLGLDTPVLNSITPAISIRTQISVDDSPPVALGIRASLSSLVLDNFILDTSVAARDSAEIRLTKPLPSGAKVYFRSYARTADGTIVQSFASPPRMVPRWLTLVFPNAPAGAILDDQQPEFIWSSARVSVPPGPWTYDFSVTISGGGPPIFSESTTDTTMRVPFPLEFNTSYRWAVTARLQDQSAERVTSSSSFSIVDESIPLATLLYNPFPSPFPSTAVQFACIWFDLAQRTYVTIDVLDIRTNRVRRIHPEGNAITAFLEPGKYGRSVSPESTCNGEFTWDGTDANGRRVIPGVYLMRMRAGGREFVKPVVFRG